MLSLCPTKNILRISEADLCQKVKNIEAQAKKHYSYKKKRVSRMSMYLYKTTTTRDTRKTTGKK